jgi:hypothetical protein
MPPSHPWFRLSYNIWWSEARSCVISRNKYVFNGTELLAPRQTPNLEVVPFFGCPRLTQYILSWPPHLAADSSIRNPRTCRCVANTVSWYAYVDSTLVCARTSQNGCT